ncbi:hypothetical protein ACFX2A_025451 [Malus domestica]
MAGFQLGPDDSESRAAPSDLVSDVDSTAAEISPQNSTPHDRRHEESSSGPTRISSSNPPEALSLSPS